MSIHNTPPHIADAVLDARAPVNPSSHYRARNISLAAAAVGFYVVALMLLSIAIGGVYFKWAYGPWVPVQDFAAVGALVTALYVMPFLIRGEFTIEHYASGQRRLAAIFLAWNGAFLALSGLAFLTKTTSDFSRVWVVAFYALGLIAIIALEGIVRRAVQHGLMSGRIAPRRLMLVGTERELRRFNERLATVVPPAERLAVKVAAIATLPVDMLTPDETDLSLAGRSAIELAVARSRVYLPDDVILMLSWDNPEAITRCVDAFSLLPVAVHLDGGAILKRTSDMHIRRLGAASALALTARPPSDFNMALKRTIDIVSAGLGLIILSPLVAVIAILIKRESEGPIFFRQDRLGFNQQTFKIWKFRSMVTLDNGDRVDQAQENDPRITRVGKWLRKWNLDELPQLINVIRGDMSLIGPRPHAVAHDRMFQERISRYPRRLNMRPGITGWAQVNGFRGETDTDEKMRRRVDYDLYYIDNWSTGFDLYILLLTFMSPRAHRNAR
jgi:polysaccharide biosynthesis protein PslA